MTFSAWLYSFQIDVFRVGGPTLIVIGTFSCLTNLMVFGKNTLRKNPCTICFIILNLINLTYFYLGLLFTTLAVGYSIDPSTSNLGFCRFRYYIAIVLSCWQSSCLILAAIDRMFITSPNAVTRQRSTLRFVTVSIIVIGLFWSVVNSHAWFFTEILQFGPGYYVCFYQQGLYNTIMSYFTVTVNGTLPPLLMTLFGWQAVRNVHKVRARKPDSRTGRGSNVGVGRPYALQSKDRQLIRILFANILSFIVCKLPSQIFLIYQQITQNTQKSSEQQVIEQSILQLTFFCYFINNAIECYSNILVSKTFRVELKQFLANLRPVRFR